MEHISSWSMLTMFTHKTDESTNVTQKNTKALLQASREDGLQVNTGKTKYVVMSRHQNVGQNHNLLAAIKSLENVAKFKYFGKWVTRQDRIHEEIKSSLNSRNALNNSVQTILFS
jgi:hypothetical protein